MNSRQRRLVRRAEDRDRAADMAAYMGDDCHACGRPAHGVEHRGPPVCAEHNTDLPF